MSDNPTTDNGLFRLLVGLEDADRFEYILRDENVDFQSYQETVQDVVKVFMFHNSDSSKIDTIIKENEITTGHVDHAFVSSNVVKLNKMYLTAVLVVIVLTFIVLTFVK